MDQVAQVRDKIDIVALLGEFITVTRAGKNFKAVCPFHNEKSPSFIISPERQIWHCFGCGKGGDCYTFLMEYERLEFPEALRLLANRVGIILEKQKAPSNFASKKERIYQMNTLAKEFYHYILTKHPAGKKALEYIKGRGVTDKVIETFGIGFSPHSGNTLVNYLTKKKQYTHEEVVEAGLAGQTANRVYDFFRGRVMFPLIDHRDNVVGFSGRILEQNDNVGKYVNTRETLVYHKGEHFFGINITKDAIRRENQAIIVEGELDLISCFEHGIGNVVGVKGTALTEAQVALLSRFAEKITFCFDGDKAGQEAIKRSLSVVEGKGITATVIKIPSGKDPDEALKHDAGLFKKAVREDLSVYDYLLEQTVASVDSATVEGKKVISDSLLPFIAQIKNEIIKEHYLRKLSTQLETSYESIVKEMQRIERQQRTPKTEVIQEIPKVKRLKEEVVEEYLLALVLQHEKDGELMKKIIEVLSGSLPRERAVQKVLYHLLEYFERETEFNAKAFGDTLPSELLPTYEIALLFPLPQFAEHKLLMAEVDKTTRQLKRLYIQKKMKELVKAIEQEEDEEKSTLLKKEYSSYTALLEKAS